MVVVVPFLKVDITFASLIFSGTMPKKIDSLIVSKGSAITLLSNFNTVVGILKDLGPVHGFICLERYYFIFYLYKCVYESVMKKHFFHVKKHDSVYHDCKSPK